jgi:uncharacterized protein (TIGR02594 family)
MASSIVQPFKYLEIAAGEIGQVEIAGEADNPRILEYFKTTSYQAQHDEVAWCAAFVNWCLVQSGLKGTNSASAFSFMNWGIEVKPCLGCVAVIDYGNGKGHVGFLVGWKGPSFVMLGGNQSNAVTYKLVLPRSIAHCRMPTEILPELASITAASLDYATSR